MKEGTLVVASRYSCVLLGVAKDTGNLDKVSIDLEALVEQIGLNPIFQNLLLNQALTKDQVLAVLLRVCEYMKFSDIVTNLIRQLVMRGRLSLIVPISECYTKMLLVEKDILLVRVTLSFKANEQKRSAIKKDLEKKFAKTLQIEWLIDSELLGGAVIETGCYLFDLSIKNCLENIMQAIHLDTGNLTL